MSVNQDAVDQRVRGARAGLWRLAGPWWLMLITGIAWLIISVAVLRFRLTSITTVGVLIGVVFLAATFNEFLLASIHVGWRWAHVLLGIFFLVGAIWASATPLPGCLVPRGDGDPHGQTTDKRSRTRSPRTAIRPLTCYFGE